MKYYYFLITNPLLMKKIFFSLFLISFFTNSYSQYVNIPDVMGISNPNNSIGAPIDVISPRDTLPVFPGFPKVISSSSFEGAIFCNMDSDADLEIVQNVGFTIQAFNKDASNVPGWPKTVSQPLQGAPAYGDIDGDGQNEIVCVTTLGASSGFIHAYKTNGTAVTGFPINHGYSSRTPVLADLNNDGKMEIIVNKRLPSAGEVYVYRGDATIYPGWPKPINHVPASSSAVGDITGDGIPEIISESYTSLYAWDRDGNTITGFPFILPGDYKNSYSSPVLADVNGDSFREIIFGSQSQSGPGCVHILKKDGTVLTGWPKFTDNWVYTPPAVGLINGDNILDIAVGDQVLSGTPIDKLYVWDANGNSLTGFPVTNLNAINTQPILADIDGDNNIEIIVDDNTTFGSDQGQYLAFNHDGTPVTGWPITLNGTTFFNVPCATDIDRDGLLDIIGNGTAGGPNGTTYIYLWKTNKVYNTSKIILPVFQYNIQHTGVYNTPTLVNIKNEPSFVSDYKLHQNYPNPFNPSTEIKFEIPKSGFVSLKIFDMTGKMIGDLVNQNLNPGSYNIVWNAGNVSSGVYYYKLITNEFSQTKKMILLK
jgi:hypothetical protein